MQPDFLLHLAVWCSVTVGCNGGQKWYQTDICINRLRWGHTPSNQPRVGELVQDYVYQQDELHPAGCLEILGEIYLPVSKVVLRAPSADRGAKCWLLQ